MTSHGTTPDTTSNLLTNKRAGLLEHHRMHLQASGLTDATIADHGIYSETSIETLKQLSGFRRFPKAMPCIVFPYLDRAGSQVQLRLRPDKPIKLGGSEAKYLSPKGADVRAYFPREVWGYVDEPRQELLITEGEKKALCATQFGFPCIGLAGVWMWKEPRHERLISDLANMPWRGRKVFIAFDSDIVHNTDIQDAEKRLAAQLLNLGAIVSCVRIPEGAANG